MLTVSPLRSIAGAYLRLPAKQQALVYRLGLIIVVGLLAYVLVELAWQLVVSGGHCTSCPDPDAAAVGAAGAAGGAAAAGSRDRSPKGKDWLGDAMNDDRPRPATTLTPEEEEEGKRAFELMKIPTTPEKGSLHETWNEAVDGVQNIGERLGLNDDDGR